MTGEDGSGYSADYYQANGSDRDRVALRWYAALVDRFAPAGPALDFGCGPGWMMRRMSRTRSCDGLDISAYSRHAARHLNPGSTVYATAAAVPDEAYAAVSAIHVLEHLPALEVPSALDDLVRMLVPGGTLLVVTPDSGGRAARIQGAKWRALSDPTHINLQGHAQWRAALVDAGLTIVAEGADGLWDPPYGNWLVDRLRLAPIAAQVVLGRVLLRPGSGESCVLAAAKPGPGASRS